MSNIENLINQSKGMPAFAAINYLDYHRKLQLHKRERLRMELEKTEQAIKQIKYEVERRQHEIAEKKKKALEREREIENGGIENE